MAKVDYCPFYSKMSSLDCWEFKGPKHNGLQNKGGSWNWSLKGTSTNNTGPTSGHTHGYIYIESSSPTKKNSVFEIISKEAFDFSVEGSVEFWYNANVSPNSVKLELQIWDGFKWVSEFTLIPQIKENKWIFVDVNLHRYTSTNCYVKFKITILTNKKVYLNDFALDSIKIISKLDSSITTDIDTFLETEGLKRLKKGRKGKRFLKGSVEDLTTLINNLEQKERTEDIIIHDNDNISYLIKRNK